MNQDNSNGSDRQTARLRLRFGRNAGAAASLNLTSSGLRSVALLVSSILLATAVLVRVAVREGKRGSGGKG